MDATIDLSGDVTFVGKSPSISALRHAGAINRSQVFQVIVNEIAASIRIVGYQRDYEDRKSFAVLFVDLPDGLKLPRGWTYFLSHHFSAQQWVMWAGPAPAKPFLLDMGSSNKKVFEETAAAYLENRRLGIASNLLVDMYQRRFEEELFDRLDHDDDIDHLDF